MQIQSQSVVRVLVVVVARADIGNPESLLAESGAGTLSCTTARKLLLVHRLGVRDKGLRDLRQNR